jgi:hypothetical protein
VPDHADLDLVAQALLPVRSCSYQVDAKSPSGTLMMRIGFAISVSAAKFTQPRVAVLLERSCTYSRE